MINKCPEKTYGRLSDVDNKVRRDLCRGHFESTVKFYNTDGETPVIIVEIWGE